MQNSIFFVDSEPYCVWDPNLKDRNSEFLNGLDAEYFRYAAEAHLEVEDKKHAAIALRLALHHALETFFSLIGAFVQAPDCIYAWLSKCSTTSLRSVVSRISEGDLSLPRKLVLPATSWHEISRIVYSALEPGSKIQIDAIDGFAQLWQRLAYEFQGANQIDEYNALKHGFRASMGGFALAFAPTPLGGGDPSESDFMVLGKSDFGSRYFKISPITNRSGERSLAVASHSNNWSLDSVIALSQLIYFSINNVISALHVAHGHASQQWPFYRPESQEGYLSPWQQSVGVTSMQWNPVADVDTARSLTKNEILEILAK